MKKLVKFILLTMIMSMVGNQVFAYDFKKNNKDGKTIYYNYNNDSTGLVVTSPYNVSYSGDIVIPEEVTENGKTLKVISIAAGFWGKELISVTLPNSVKFIGDAAFEGSSLTEITLSNNLETIGKNVFRDCKNLTSITIPNTVTTIKRSAFQGCSGLTTLTIPNSVSRIEFEAFEGCSGLKSVILGDNVECILKDAFANCTGLTTITIPKNVTLIQDGAFSGIDFETVVSLIEWPNAISGIDTGDLKTFNDYTFLNATLYIPVGRRDFYETTGWVDFAHVIEGFPTSISPLNSNLRITESVRFNLGGNQIKQPQRGVNIIRMSDGTSKKVIIK